MSTSFTTTHLTIFPFIHPIRLIPTFSCGMLNPQSLCRFILCFCSFLWDNNDSSIKSLPPLILQSDNVFSCYSCEIKVLTNNFGLISREFPEAGNGVLHFQNNIYHVGDFVYVARPTFDTPDLFRVGQIRSLGQGSTIIVRKFKRCKNSQISVCFPQYHSN
jgi:hypothetical protein